MNSLRGALQSAVSSSEATIAQVWMSLSSEQKDQAVKLFQQALTEQNETYIKAPFVIGFDVYGDVHPADTNRVESFYYGLSTCGTLGNVRVFSNPIRVSRQRSCDDVYFQDIVYTCVALLTHQHIHKHEVLGINSSYISELWITSAGLDEMKRCMLETIKK